MKFQESELAPEIRVLMTSAASVSSANNSEAHNMVKNRVSLLRRDDDVLSLSETTNCGVVIRTPHETA